jgi:hypothetical protein
MLLVSFITSSLLLLTAQGTFARRHHDAALAARDVESTGLQPRNLRTNQLQTNDFNIMMPGAKWGFDQPAIATSFIPDNNVPISGACGWGGKPRHKSNGGVIHGAAQMYTIFGNGHACGTCLKLNATERHIYGGIGPFIVTVVNSCPGTCHGLDLEVDGIEAWLQRKRVGQLGSELDHDTMAQR